VPFQLPGSTLTLQGFLLRHNYPYLSTAFLVQNDLGEFVLYFGDVGPDSVENSLSNPYDLDTNRIIWEHIAPLISDRLLFAIFIECSYLDPRAPGILFGHLTPSYLSQELAVLEGLVKNLSNEEKPLAGLNVVVTHIKQLPNGENIIPTMKQQLEALNTFCVNYIFPEQGVPLVFKGPPYTCNNSIMNKL